jgi:site-specific DNA-methyltransferase (adenine-specific)
MKNIELKIVSPSDIWSSERCRKDLGDISELVHSFKSCGIIEPLAVNSCLGPNNEPYKLLAGGRRLEAINVAGIEEVPVRIYTEELTEYLMKKIELEENLIRKNLTYIEDCNLKSELHNLQVKENGIKVAKTIDAAGWSLRDTARLLNKDHKGVIDDINLAKKMDEFPQLDWEGCKNKSEAKKMFSKFEERIVRANLSERSDKLLGKSAKNLVKSYQVGDFFERVKDIPDKSIDFVEVDPPYGIDLNKIKRDFKSNYSQSYNEVNENEYLEFLTKTINECYRVMSNNSWLIFWFAPEPWIDPIYQILTNAGFQTRRQCGIWAKPMGQTMNPDRYFGSCYEMFFYARKGDAVINLDKRGRNNIFSYNPVSPKEKIHPTERPIDLMLELLSVFVWEGSRVLVPFAGSGVTLKAAFQLKMFPIGYDLSQEYKDSFTAKILSQDV